MAQYEDPGPVERFQPTGGMFIGWGSLAVATALLVVVALSEPNIGGVRISLVIAVVALLVWMALLRPRAAAYADRLVLKNMASDTELPLAGIQAVVVRSTLNVWVEERRYVCIGIGRSTRKLVGQRGRGPMAVLGLEQDDRRFGLGQVAEVDASHDYATFVEDRIADLARSAKRRSAERPPPVRRSWAVPELGLLALLVGALIMSLLV